MNNEKFQDKYNEAIEDLKSQKMDWSFEDFISKVEEKEEDNSKIIPLKTNTKPKVSKFFWMAASLILVAGFSFLLFSENSAEMKNEAIAKSIQKQQNEFAAENQIVQNAVADTLKSNEEPKIDSLEATITSSDDVLDQIVSKKERIKKVNKQRFTSVDQPKSKNSNQDIPYQSNYVIINGQKIASEEEAINVARYSMKMITDKVNQTLASAVDASSNDN